MSAPYIIFSSWPSLFQKISKLVKIWQGYDKNNFNFFIQTRFIIITYVSFTFPLLFAFIDYFYRQINVLIAFNDAQYRAYGDHSGNGLQPNCESYTVPSWAYLVRTEYIWA